MVQQPFDPNEMTDEELDAAILDVVRYEKNRNKVLVLNPRKIMQAKQFFEMPAKIQKAALRKETRRN